MTKPWVKVLEKVQLFERAHSPNESNTESSGFKINFTECILFVSFFINVLHLFGV
jgi:hypothetical protein